MGVGMSNNSKSLHGEMLAKAAESGLSPADVKRLHFEALTADEAIALLPRGEAHRCMNIPYFDINGQLTSFFRIRYLGAPTSFRAIGSGKRWRYRQLKGSRNELYLSPLIDWKRIAKDVKEPIIFTEGELKAASACKFGFPTIGLGGVQMFTYVEDGQTHLLKDFDAFEWKDRTAIILYDSDLAVNPDVARAENRFAKELAGLGAIPKIGRLPALPDASKTGLDDFLVARGPEALRVILDEAFPHKESQNLLKFNEDLIAVHKPAIVMEVATGLRMAPDKFTKFHYLPQRHRVLLPNGNFKQVQTAVEWLAWEHRNIVRGLTYAPGKPTIVAGHLNIWEGWGCEPEEGDTGYFDALLKHSLRELHQDELEWYLDWMAWGFQHPGAKLKSSIMSWSRTEGTGKSLLAESLARIYGPANVMTISQKTLRGSWNEWIEGKQLIIANEISGVDKLEAMDIVKDYITNETVSITRRFVDTYTMPNCAQFMFSSNHNNAALLTDPDRRYFVIHYPEERLDPEFAWKHYRPWMMESMAGPAALFHRMLHRKINLNFNPHGGPPITTAKLAMIEEGRSDLDRVAIALRDEPASVLINSMAFAAGTQPIPYTLWTATELCERVNAYDNRLRTVSTSALMGRMRAFGLRPYCDVDGKPRPVGIGGAAKWLWVIHPDPEVRERLLQSKPGELAKLYCKERGIPQHLNGRSVLTK